MELAHLERALRQECQLASESRLVVGVSGGADSLCLLDGLHRLGVSLVVAHFDHGLRPESAEEARQVAAIAGRMGLPFVTERQDVGALAADRKLSIEEAARTARYRFLFEQARLHQAQAVAVAHTADDQVETVLMHLLRGAGLSGLKAMRSRVVLAEWDERIPLVRPLLGVWREETEDWCRRNNLDFLTDLSNQDPAFFRNRLRLQLIPNLRTYNPNIKAILWRMANALAGDWELIESLTDEAWQLCWQESGAGWVSLSLAEFETRPNGLQRAVLRRAMGRLKPGLRDIDFGLVERGLDWIRSPGSARGLILADGLWLKVERGRIILSEGIRLPTTKAWPQITPGTELQLNVPGEVRLENGWTLRAEQAAPGNPHQSQQDDQDYDAFLRLNRVAWLDAARTALPLSVRSMRPGERLAPLGMAGKHVKLSDLYTNIKLAQTARAGWPLVISAGCVAWVCGLRLGNPYKVEANTREVIRLELLHTPQKEALE